MKEKFKLLAFTTLTLFFSATLQKNSTECLEDSSTMKESVKVECGIVTKVNFVELANSQAIYPSWPFSNDQLRKGAFLVYAVCKFHRPLTSIVILYAFLGISLATKNYVNPSIDIIKKRGIVSQLFS
jgi:hypothetical protein